MTLDTESLLYDMTYIHKRIIETIICCGFKLKQALYMI